MGLMSTNFSNLDWTAYTITRISGSDILDILIVTYFIYKISLWIKDTRARPLFKGIGVVLMISVLSFVFNLTTISWIVTNTFNIGIIALIILFQPELRRALEQIGKGKIALPFNLYEEDALEAEYTNVVEQILKSVKILSNSRTGGLIVVQKQMSLTDLEQTGTKLDALVSAALLINIFEDKTPLHDGAVIIRNNRISAASCILPLTPNEIGKELGTRHRAAVGTTEIYDAYAIVVSEETGHLNVSHEGKLFKNLSQDQIRKLLLGDDKPIKKKFALWRGTNEKNA